MENPHRAKPSERCYITQRHARGVTTGSHRFLEVPTQTHARRPRLVDNLGTRTRRVFWSKNQIPSDSRIFFTMVLTVVANTYTIECLCQPSRNENVARKGCVVRGSSPSHAYSSSLLSGVVGHFTQSSFLWQQLERFLFKNFY